MQATEGTIHTSTANSSEDLLLQPKQTGGLLHGLFPNEDKKVPEKDEDKKVWSLPVLQFKKGLH